MKNSNLKKLSRNSQKEISGGAGGGIKKCNYSFECPGGSCCRNACVYYPCPEL
ncbi:bacteriocin-like protein [Chryseobacterium sp. 22458]|uniref:bacteriocin-like protein n=1 Tax=Chryseobacterium sp. 22458 TaxID=3453921 RepID=UPI003F84D0DA